MSVLRTTTDGRKIFKCPGCREYHSLRIRTADGVRPSWEWNGSNDKPTFKPSILATTDFGDHREVCHSFVTDGKIQFLNDCTHPLAGKTVDLAPWPYARGEFGGVID